MQLLMYVNAYILYNILIILMYSMGSTYSLVVSVAKSLPANAGYAGLLSGPGRPPGGGNDNSLQHPCLGNPTDRRAW